MIFRNLKVANIDIYNYICKNNRKWILYNQYPDTITFGQ